MPRVEFTKAVQRAALERAAGRCEGTLSDGDRCPTELQTGRYHFDHVIPTEISGDASLANCACLCRACHAAKTVTDQGVIARTRRIRDRHAGITDPHRQVLPGSRKSPFKRLLNGGVVLRATGQRLDRNPR